MISQTLELAYTLVNQLLDAFLADVDFTSKLTVAFGNNIDLQLAESLIEGFVTEETSLSSYVEVRDAEEINGANGAFAASLNKIFVAREFVENSDVEAIADLLIEELGHYLDSQLNPSDSPGDEGDIFARLVAGESIDGTTLQALKAENDHATVILDGEVVEIEQDIKTTEVNTVLNQIQSYDLLDLGQFENVRTTQNTNFFNNIEFTDGYAARFKTYTPSNTPYAGLPFNPYNDPTDPFKLITPTTITPLGDSTAKGLIIHTATSNNTIGSLPVEPWGYGNLTNASVGVQPFLASIALPRGTKHLFAERTFHGATLDFGNLSYGNGDVKVTLVWTGPASNDLDLWLEDAMGNIVATPTLTGIDSGNGNDDNYEQINLSLGGGLPGNQEYSVKVGGNSPTQDFSLFITANPIFRSGHGIGDVHLATFDGKYYDLQSVGEFILVESLIDDFQVQVRQEITPNPNLPNTSANAAFATTMDGFNVVFDRNATVGQEITINGTPITVADGQTFTIIFSTISRDGNKYTFTHAGPDAIIGTPDDDVITATDGYWLNIDVDPADYRGTLLQGLLGNADGNSSNDFTLRDGTNLGSNPSAATIHTTYADSWRITQEESLFGTPVFQNLEYPLQYFSLTDLAEDNPEMVNNGFMLGREALIPEGNFLNGAVFDFVVTGDEEVFQDAKEFADLVLQDDDGVVQLGSISGSKWEDLNGNGIWDNGENALAGWQIYVDSIRNGQLDPGEVSTFTDANGFYSFVNLGSGTYTIAEVIQTGYEQTYPLIPQGNNFHVVDLQPGEVVENINFGNQPAVGEIHGYKWNDINGDGVWDDNEEALEGWTIFLDDNNNGKLDDGEQFTVTDANGQYWFTELEAGTYNLAEIVSDGWQQTSPSSQYVINLKTGEIIGDHPGITVVSAPTDSNNDDYYEVVLKLDYQTGFDSAKFLVEYDKTPEDWTVNIGDSVSNNGYGGDGGDTSNAAEMQIKGGQLGVYSNILPGYENVTNGDLKLLKVDNFVTEPSTVFFEVEDEFLGWNNQQGISGNLQSPYLYTLNGQDTLYGPINYDIYAAFNRVISSAFRNGSGVSQVTIELPTSHTVNLEPGQVVENINFGNQQKPSEIHGYKWHDVNGDGVWDDNEEALEGWTIYLDDNNNGKLDDGEQFTVTDANGKYWFTGLEAGTYNLAEVITDGWKQTSPVSEYVIDLKTGEIIGDHPGISVVSAPRDFNNDDYYEVVLKLDYDQGFDSAKFLVEYDKTPEDWTVNIGDSFSNNGYGGDGGHTSNAAEMQIKAGQLDVYSNILPGYEDATGGDLKLLKVDDFVTEPSTVVFEVQDESFGWNNQQGTTGNLQSPYLYTLNGQDTLYGPVNSDIYAAFNRVIGSAFRNGSGVSQVTIQLPTSHTVNVEQGQIVDNINFGNQQQPGQIHGYKWNDVDGDGVWDDNEQALEGWTIYLDSNNNNHLDFNETSTVTDENGAYWFTNLDAGSYTVAEALQIGYQQTYPLIPQGNNSHTIDLQPGQIVENVNFGNKELSFPVDPETGQPYQPGQLIVEFDTGITEAEIQQIALANGAIAVENIIPSESSLANEFSQWRILKFDLATDLVPIKNNLANNNQINVSSFDHIVSIQALPALPNDTNFNDLWGLHNTGQTGGTVDADIDAPEAWCKQKGDDDIVVAVIDTGIDYNHADLASNMWINAGEIAGDGIDNDFNGYVDDIYGYDFYNTDSDPWDDHSHGTHVAGTIGAVGNNNSGVIGVSPNVSLMALKSFSAFGGGTLSLAATALGYAIDNGADVVNASFRLYSNDPFLEAMVTAANNAGVLFVAAAGNENNNNDVTPVYPGNYTQPNVISVAATDHNDDKAWFSNYGSTTVDLGAPGQDILSTIPGNGYGYKSGTSMAAPHVSGAAALLLAENPSLTPAQVITELMNNVDPVPGLSGITVSGGRLNVNNALMSVGPIGNNAPVINNDILQTGKWRLDVSVGDINNPPHHFELPVFDDPDGDGMHYTATLIDGSPLPSWLTLSQDNAFDSDDDVIYLTGTPPAGQTFPITVKLTATDCWGASTDHIFSIYQYIDGYGVGDVHFKTFDGRRYDMQEDGEFIFIQSDSGDWQIQTRQEPWVGNPTRASVNTAFATEMDGHTVIYDMYNPANQKLEIDGVNITLNTGKTHNVGNSIIERNNNRYTFRFAGPDGTLFTGDDDRFVATQGSTHINLNVYPAFYRAGQMKGLLGDGDGNPNNDFVLRDGTQLPSNISFADIHEVFAESWRVTQAESLFGTPIFDDPNFPIYFSKDDIDPQQWENALQAARDAGIPEAVIEDVAFDFFLGGEDPAFLDEQVELFEQSITLEIAPTEVSESGDDNLIYTFTRNGNTDGILIVNYEIGGTATINEDYTLNGASGLAGNLGTISFGVGESSKTLIVDPMADDLLEGDETVTITLGTAPEYTINTTDAVAGIIADDVKQLKVTIEGITYSNVLDSYGDGSVANGNSVPQDSTQGIVTYFDDGNGVKIEHNAWKAWTAFDTATYTVTPNTVLRFDYMSTEEGEIQGIGFDDNDDFFDGTQYLFQVFGTQVFDQVIQDFNNYEIDQGWKSYQIKVGEYFTGTFDRLYLVNDHDSEDSLGSDSSFRNIVIFENNINLNNPPVANDDSYTTDEATVINDNFVSNDNDLDNDSLNITQINASVFTEGDPITLDSQALLTINNDGTFSYDPNGKFDNLEAGETATDSFTYTISDGIDSDTATVNLTINGVSSPPITDQLTVTLDGTAISNALERYGDASVLNGNSLPQDTDDAVVTYTDNGNEVKLENNAWKYWDLGNYNVTENTHISLQFRSEEIGELQGFGLDNNDNLFDHPHTFFQLYGSDTYGALEQGFNNYQPTNSWQNYEINLGQYFTGNYDRLVFFNDFDANDNIGGSAEFRNVVLFENVNSPINTSPVANDDSYTTDEATVINDNFVSNDDDLDNDSLTITEINGSIFTEDTPITLGSGALLTINNDGSFSYDPNSQFDNLGAEQTATDSFTYTISDGIDSDIATVNLTINGISSPPVTEQLTVTVEGMTLSNTLERYGEASVLNGNSLPQDTDEAVVTYSDNGNEVKLENNSWKSLDITGYTVTENSSLSFQFRSDEEAEIQGLGLDNDDDLFNDSNTIFQLYGTQTFANQAFNDYQGLNDPQATDGWKDYTISLGQYFTGEYDRLVFFNDNDTVDNLGGAAQFRNIVLSEVA
ncbi:MAG: S8 family serine peptidase [Crocosphaera sp.]